MQPFHIKPFYIIYYFVTSLDSSKQRTRLRRKVSKEKEKLKSLVEQYNSIVDSEGGDKLDIADVLAGNFTDDGMYVSSTLAAGITSLCDPIGSVNVCVCGC